jgi:hypothetical protein
MVRACRQNPQDEDRSDSAFIRVRPHLRRAHLLFSILRASFTHLTRLVLCKPDGGILMDDLLWEEENCPCCVLSLIDRIEHPAPLAVSFRAHPAP